jgi:hypothetical protein
MIFPYKLMKESDRGECTPRNPYTKYIIEANYFYSIGNSARETNIEHVFPKFMFNKLRVDNTTYFFELSAISLFFLINI